MRTGLRERNAAESDEAFSIAIGADFVVGTFLFDFVLPDSHAGSASHKEYLK